MILWQNYLCWDSLTGLRAELLDLAVHLSLYGWHLLLSQCLYMTSIGKEAYELIQNNDIIKMIYDYNPIMQLAVKF